MVMETIMIFWASDQEICWGNSSQDGWEPDLFLFVKKPWSWSHKTGMAKQFLFNQSGWEGVALIFDFAFSPLSGLTCFCGLWQTPDTAGTISDLNYGTTFVSTSGTGMWCSKTSLVQLSARNKPERRHVFNRCGGNRWNRQSFSTLMFRYKISVVKTR